MMPWKNNQLWKRKLLSLKSKLSTKLHKLVIFKITLKKCKNKFLLLPQNYKLKKTTSTRETSKLMNFSKQDKNYKMKLTILNVKRNNLLKRYHNFNFSLTLKNNSNKNIFLSLNKNKPKIKNSRPLLTTLWNKSKELSNLNWKNHNTS